MMLHVQRETLLKLIIATVLFTAGYYVFTSINILDYIGTSTWKNPSMGVQTLATNIDISNQQKKKNTKSSPGFCTGNGTDQVDVASVIQTHRPKVDIFIAIITAPHLLVRRTAVRNTWMSTVSHYSVSYRFFTDSQGLEPRQLDQLNEERALYNDLEFIPTKGGMWLTHRYLHAMFWAYQRYDFKFFLKTDDDYFICLNHLSHDLQNRRQEKYLLWGWLHCYTPRVVYMDEGFLVATVAIVEELIRRNNSICCHPNADQMVGVWMTILRHEGFPIQFFADNDRLSHVRAYLKSPLDETLCKKYIGIHQSYPEYMYRYWNLTKDSWFSLPLDEFKAVEIQPFKAYCSLPPVFEWQAFPQDGWRHEPKPCWDSATKWKSVDGLKWMRGREFFE